MFVGYKYEFVIAAICITEFTRTSKFRKYFILKTPKLERHQLVFNKLKKRKQVFVL